ncbi:hypothetical protein D3C74_393810 [compost metagenome]
MLAGIRHNLFKLTAVHRKRLLAEHRLACTQCEQRIVFMKRVGCPDINSIHLRIIDQILVRGMSYGNAVLSGKFICTLLIARTYSIGKPVRCMGQIGCELVRDPACAENSPFYLVSVTDCH